MTKYELEVKSLLDSSEGVTRVKRMMHERDATCVCVARSKQFNHYFVGGSLTALFRLLARYLSTDSKDRLFTFTATGNSCSVRTRLSNDKVYLVVKSSVDGGTSSNAVARLEFDELVPCTLEQIDALVLEAGYACQAKWSRSREEYTYKGLTVCIDKNAGYGYIAEFEKIVNDETLLVESRAEIDKIMLELGVFELAQDRLERMFAFYNCHWRDYYGTDKVFSVE